MEDEKIDFDYYTTLLERISRELVDLSREVDTLIDQLEYEKDR